jgi:primosomal protein N' (replication factor Y)
MPTYPPFVSLANIVVSGTDQRATADAMIEAGRWIQSLVARTGLRDVLLVGPAPCPIDRIKDRWRWHLLLKSTRKGTMTRLARYIAEKCPVPKRADLRLIVDREPVSLL